MKGYTSKVELTNAIKASYKKYIDEFENISEDLKDKRFEEVDRTPAENLAYQVGWTTLLQKMEKTCFTKELIYKRRNLWKKKNF